MIEVVQLIVDMVVGAVARALVMILMTPVPAVLV